MFLDQVFCKGEGNKRTRSSSCRRACSTTPSCPLMTMHILLRSRISVRHTTRESMLNPRPARIPDTRDNTPGSFCTRQFSTCLNWGGREFWLRVKASVGEREGEGEG